MISIVMLAAISVIPELADQRDSEVRSPAERAAPTNWQHGPPSDPSYFPIAVWLQDPRNAARYKQAGINLYVALWEGPNEQQLAKLKEAGIPVICHQNAFALSHKDDPIIVGWMHGDEPDNAQEVVDRQTRKRSYGPFIPPAKIIADYEKLRASDPTRPIMLNLGQGVANDEWVGRGPGAKLDDYKDFVKGADIVSFDVYPVAGLGRNKGVDKLWYVPKGIDRLKNWTEGKKSLWNCIECTHIDDAKYQATPHQVKAEVWMSLIHGSKGLIYFVHQFQPKFNEHALLDDPEMLAAVTVINKQIRELAPVLNSPTAPGLDVKSSIEGVPIDASLVKHRGTDYLFAVGMRNAPAKGTFAIPGLSGDASAEVLGEGRNVKVVNGRFEDDFAPYDVHLYAIRR
jgi:hypothetical protein